jgi:hypothetical protein
VPRVALNVTPAAKAGVQVNFGATDPVNGNFFANDGKTILILRNTSGVQQKITLRTPKQVDGDLPCPNRDVVIPSGGVATIAGAFDPLYYNQPDGTVSLDSTAAVSVLALSTGF